MLVKFEKSIKIKFLRIYFLFGFFVFLVLFSLYKVYDISTNIEHDGLSKINYTSKKKSIPDIYTNDNILLASNLDTYQLFLNPKHVNKKFINIYFNIIENATKKEIINKKEILKKIYKNKRVKILGKLYKYEIKNISLQNKLLFKIGFYKKFSNSQHRTYKYGAEFILNKHRNRFYNSSISNFEPFFGYYNFDNEAINGLEKYIFNNNFFYSVNFFKKDRKGNILYKKNDDFSTNENENIKITINYKLQLAINEILKNRNIEIEADNIIVSVVETKTGKIRSLTQLKRYNPFNLNDESYYNNDFIKYLYEPGSIFKPITLSIALENNIVKNLKETIDTNNGKLKIGRKTITDEHEYEQMTLKEIISHSSNVGIAKLALKFENNEFVDTLYKYEFFNSSELELPFSKKYIFSDRLKKKIKQNKLIQRAVSSFGYAFQVTPLNMSELYNTIANNGIKVPLTIIENNICSGKRIISNRTNKLIKETLKSVVEEGTGIRAQNKFLNVFGKTGTAHISSKGKYIHSYNSSFIGFVDDNKNTYTINVLVIKPNWTHHFASLSAVPIFNDISKSLIKLNFLNPILNK